MNDHIIKLTAQITINYIKFNTVDASILPKLITEIYNSLTSIMQATQVEDGVKASSIKNSPRSAVNIKKSLTNRSITCLECGQVFKTLRKHLKSSHNLSPHEYRNKWGLSPDYPMLTPEYSQRRSKIAKDTGLGET